MNDIRSNMDCIISSGGYKRCKVAEAMGITSQQLCDIIAKRRKIEAMEFLRFCDFVRLPPERVKTYPVNVVDDFKPSATIRKEN